MIHQDDKKAGKVMHNLIILDESGSMRSIMEQVISGANKTIMTIRNAQEQMPDLRQLLTFVTFDSRGEGKDVRTIFENQPITEVRNLTERDYSPYGCTPLYDAMGISLAKLQPKVRNGEYALVTIITDGLENASREYSGKAIKDIVALLREKGWTFAYIGANQDAVEVATELNIDNALDYKATPTGTKVMMDLFCESAMDFFKCCDGDIARVEGKFFEIAKKKNK